MSRLEVQDLLVQFGSGFRVGPATFSMDCGILHILGPNGGGKTTLMRAISGGLAPAQGYVWVSGKDVHRDASTRRHVSFVSATPELPEFLTVTEAFQFVASLRRVPDWDGKSLCDALNLDPTLTLAVASAGQRQKAELICGLVGDPEVVLLDEIFVHLDPASVSQLSDWIGDWAVSRLIILTHHGILPLRTHATLHVDRQSIVFESHT